MCRDFLHAGGSLGRRFSDDGHLGASSSSRSSTTRLTFLDLDETKEEDVEALEARPCRWRRGPCPASALQMACLLHRSSLCGAIAVVGRERRGGNRGGREEVAMAAEGREWEGRGGGRIGTLACRSGRRQDRFALPCQIKTKGWGEETDWRERREAAPGAGGGRAGPPRAGADEWTHYWVW